MFKIMIPSPLSLFAVFQVPSSFLVMFKIMIPSRLWFFAVFSKCLKSFVVPCYVQDYNSESFVVLLGVK